MGVLKLRNLLGIAAALVAAPLSLTPRAARAQDATAYSTTQRTFKVGILLVDSTTNPGNPLAGPENVDPYVFYIADQRKDIKPQGWDFSNPVASKTVTTEVYNRWLARDVNHPYRIGEPVQKNMAAYWEVSLSKTPLSELVQFDALMLSTHSLLRFSLADREKLRKLVDAGGMLWLDDCGGMRVDPAGPFFLNGLQFQGSRPDTPGAAPGTGLPFVFQPEHPILNSPYPLSIRQIARLGEYTDYRNRSLATLNPTGGPSLQAPPNPSVLTNVVGNRAMGNLPYISVGAYGSGTVVATCGDTGCAINDYVGGNNAGYGGNSGSYIGDAILTKADTEDLLFLYNLVQLGSSNATFRRNLRRVGASSENLRTPMTSVFNFTHPATPADAKVNSVSAPLIAHGRVYVAGLEPGGGAVTVRCYNAKPSYRRGDEGLPDLSLGRPYDEIWRTSIPNPSGNQPSTPVLATVFTGGTPLYEDCIFVTLGDGSVVKMLALPRDASGSALPNNIFAANPVELLGTPSTYVAVKNQNGSPGPAPAPIVYENRVYSVQPDGVVRCLDANTLGTLWKSVDAAPTDAITPTGSPTLGIVQLSDSASTRASRQTNLAARSNGSTNDVMLYVPVLLKPDASGQGETGKILPFWLGTRHEVIDQPLVPGSGNYGTRIYNGGTNTHWIANTLANPLPSFLRPVARVYDNTAAQDAGTPSGTYTGTVMDAGLIEVRDAGGNPPPPGFPAVVSVDYDLLYVPGTAAPALGPPPGATSGGNGSRNPSGSSPNPQLDLPGYTQSGDYIGNSWGFDTPVLSPEDVLFTTIRQQTGAPTGGTPPTSMGTRASLVGVREQFGSGATKLRHSFTVMERNPSTAVGGDNTAIRMPYTLPNGTTGTLIEASTFANPFLFSGAPGAAVTIPAGSGIGQTNLDPVGAPVLSSSDGMLYVMLQGPTDTGNPVTIVAAFDPNREVTLRLKPYDLAKGVLVQQIDALRYDPSPADPNTANNYWVSGTVGNGVIEGDSAAGTVTIKNMAAGQGRFSSSQSFFVTYTPRDRTQPVTVIVSPSARVQAVNNAVGDGEDADPSLPRQDFSPLLWYYVLPGTPTSGLTRIGGTLYFGFQQASVGSAGYGLLGVDANPAANDPDVRPGEAIRNIADEITRFDGGGGPVTRATAINHVRWVQPLTAPVYASPVAGPDVLAANTTDGTFAFENSTTVVADQGRIIEVGPDGTPLWSMDTTVDYQVVGGNLPIFDPVNPIPGNGRQVFERRPLSHPSVVRRLGAGDYLIADTGNNRLVRTNRGAQVTWELTKVNDPLKVLRSGESLALNSPTDVQLYLHPTLDPGTGNRIGYEEHYLVADAGNYRILEVVDYHNLDGTTAAPGEHVVVWSTRTATDQGRRLRFKSAQRVLTTEGNVYGIPKIVATVDNANASGEGASVGADFTGGSLVRLNYRPANTFFVARNATTGVPLAIAPWPATGIPVGSGYPWPHVAGASDEPTGNGGIDKVLDVVTLKMGTLLPDGITPQPADFKYRITRPTFVNQISVPGNALAFLVCDVNGVYQIESDPTVAEPNRMSVTWFFNQADYNRVNVNRIQTKVPLYDPFAQPMDIPFHPVSAQRLPNGNILIANAGSGSSSLFDDGQFRGEVLEVTGGSRVGLTPAVPLFGDFSAPAWEISARSGPVRVKIRQKMGASSATQPLEQPLFADRL